MPNGHDGAEEHRSFSVFDRWPTKWQSSFLSIRRSSALLILREELEPEKCEPMSQSHPAELAPEGLAKQYLSLGGTRLGLIDDNKVFVRHWEDEPEEAKIFWHKHIESLDEEKQREVILLLPSVSDDDSVA